MSLDQPQTLPTNGADSYATSPPADSATGSVSSPLQDLVMRRLDTHPLLPWPPFLETFHVQWICVAGASIHSFH